MSPIEHNGFQGIAVTDEPSEQISAGILPVATGKQSYVPAKDKAKPSLKDSGRLLVIGGGIVLVLLLLAFSGLSKKSTPAHKSATANRNQPQTESPNAASSQASMTPILDTNRASVQDRDENFVNPDQIARTVTKQTKHDVPASLGSVPPFENPQSWQAPPYQPGSQSVAPIDQNASTSEAISAKEERDAMDKASLVFVRNSSPSVSVKPQDTTPPIAWAVGLAPGTRLRARLESAVSTAVPTPVVAVVEYSYEQNGEIVIPAGAKAFGHLEAADRSGYLGIRFDSLMMPDGSSINLEAAATDLQLRPLRGKVEGKHTGKNILVRSFAGVGEIAATLVGRGSLDQPLSEGDLLRERVSNNIGQASDQTVANLAFTEHIVVSIPADTEIYVVLQKSVKDNPRAQQPTQAASQTNIEQLRLLLQLQQELSQSDANKTSPQ